MGAHLGESGGCPFTEQADRELVCLIPKAASNTDRSLCFSSRSLGAGSAHHCRLLPIQQKNLSETYLCGGGALAGDLRW